MKKHNGINHTWEQITVKPAKTKGEYQGAKKWQLDCFKQLKDSPRMVMNAPMGSGKTWEMCLITAYKLQKDSKLRALIAVPQTNIADGFSVIKILMPNGDKLDWIPQHNLCYEYPTEGTINAVMNFLGNPHSPEFLNDRVVLLTHSTLVAVYRRLKMANQLSLFQNSLIWIDEAHHILNSEIEDIDGQPVNINNGLGELISYFTKHEHNVQFGLSTATFFRGDRCSLLNPQMMEKFTRFNYPINEYLKTMQHLRSFKLDFVLCGLDRMKAIEEEIITGEDKKDIVYIPHPISRHSTRNKYKESDQIISLYEKKYGTRNNTKDGLIVLGDGEKQFKIIDLVDESNRPTKKKTLAKSTKDKKDLDAIVTLNMFKEGSNWIWANRVIVIGARNSLVDTIQIIGRLFRDAEGKTSIEVVHLLPFSLDQAKPEFKDNLNDYLKAIFACLILENVFDTVKVKIRKTTGAGKTAFYDNRNWLSYCLPDLDKQLQVVTDVVESIISQEHLDRSSFNKCKKSIFAVLNNHKIDAHQDVLAKYIWSALCSKTLKCDGFKTNQLNFDTLQSKNPIGYITRYTTGECGIDTLDKLREAMRAGKCMDIDKTTEVLHAMRKEGKIMNVDEYEVFAASNGYWSSVLEYRESQRKSHSKN